MFENLPKEKAFAVAARKQRAKTTFIFTDFTFELDRKAMVYQTLGDIGALKGSHFYTQSEMETRFPRPLPNLSVTQTSFIFRTGIR